MSTPGSLPIRHHGGRLRLRKSVDGGTINKVVIFAVRGGGSLQLSSYTPVVLQNDNLVVQLRGSVFWPQRRFNPAIFPFIFLFSYQDQ